MKKLLTNYSLTLLLLVAGVGLTHAQISGSVTDEAGEALIGATIRIEGTQLGAISDIDGSYTLSDAPSTGQISVSYLGYTTTTEEINGRSTINFALSIDAANSIEDVVVVGYGVVDKKDLTGSIASVKSEDFNKGVTTSPDQLISGRVAGVQSFGDSGAPGAGATIRIRGTSSVRSGNNPLIVVDGIPLDGDGATPGGNVNAVGNLPGQNPLSFINPNDIASMDVLKDASATAIYGSRGANGVIIITTKKGRQGAPTLDLNSSTGFATMYNDPDVFDANGYIAAIASEGASPNNNLGGSSDAMDAISRTALAQNYDLAMSSGSDKGTYRFSVGYTNQDGIINKTNLDKYNGKFGGDYSFFNNDRLKLDVNLLYANTLTGTAPISNDAGAEGSLIGQALQWNPTRDLYNSDGSLNQPGGDVRNPVAYVNFYDDNLNVSRFLGSLGATFNIIDELDYRFVVSADQSKGERRIEVSPDLDVTGNNGGFALLANSKLFSKQLTHTLNFRKDFNKINFNALGGFEYLTYDNEGSAVTGTGFATDAINLTDVLQSVPQSNRNISSYLNPKEELQSYFGRANLNFNDNFLFTATFRADGSSKFGDNNKYGYFPSFAGSWNLHNTLTLPDSFDQLKLRAGWGETGNQEFSSGASQTQFSIRDDNNSLFIEQSNVANPDLKWETSQQINIGVDFSFLNSRFNGSVDWFRKNTNDLLFQLDAIRPSPNVKYFDNLDGEVINSGVELTFSGFAIDKNDVALELSTNVSFLDNEFKNYEGALIETGAIRGQGLTGVRAQRLANNQPLFVYYLPTFTGFDDNGFSIFENGGEKTFVGDPNPDVLLGFSANLDVKKFSFGLNTRGAFGHQLYNNTANAVFIKGNLGNARNSSPSIVNNGEALTNPGSASTRYLEDGDYFKISDARIGYNFGSLNQDWLRNMSLSFTGQNLLLLTGYTGFDPEVNTNAEVNGVPSYGIEYTPYPSARTFTFGANFKF